MPSVFQEFYCHECDGFIRMNLNVSIDRDVKVKCPNCGHLHNRSIRGGIITGDSYKEGAEEIIAPKSAYYKTPLVLKKKGSPRASGVLPPRDPALDNLIRQSWLDRFGAKVQ